jgi:uncharacterized protein YyaL (SSP411 family)
MNRTMNPKSKATNRLIHQSSPYLLQHAHNPVDWFPWGSEALEKASLEDKPILLSIGYSACHWCHVMERESFENEEIARLMNQFFVSIKVDREERPDLDAIYMNYVQLLTGSGGWPLNVFLTPGQSPFYGGTYFPPEDRWGHPGFPGILQAVHQAYRTKKEEIQQHSLSLVNSLRQSPLNACPSTEMTPALLDRAYRNLSPHFDWEKGGMSGAPKFPSPTSLDFCLHFFSRTGNQEALSFVELTLEKMAQGGLYDQLGGGFHRYSVDDAWQVPHFEKMLYDNALLSRLYLHAYQATRNPRFERIVHETLQYVMREMTGGSSSPISEPQDSNPEGDSSEPWLLSCGEAGSGGFYSSQDADSEGEEGKFFLWSLEEIRKHLSPEMTGLICRAYSVTESGNFEGKNILHRNAAPSSGNRWESGHENALFESARKILFAAREKRIKPFRDEKILVSWNGLMLTSFAEAGAVLSRPEYIQAARQNAQYLLDHAFFAGRLNRSCSSRTSDQIPGFLDDYANFAQGLVHLFEATGERKWLDLAVNLAERILDDFWDESQACFFLSSRQSEPLLLRPLDLFDHAVPAGSSSATLVLLHLYYLTGENRFYRTAANYLKRMASAMEQSPASFGKLLCASSWQLGPIEQFVVRGNSGHSTTREFLQILYKPYMPMKIVGLSCDAESLEDHAYPFFEGKENDLETPACYVCRNQTCLPPMTNPPELQLYLESK